VPRARPAAVVGEAVARVLCAGEASQHVGTQDFEPRDLASGLPRGMSTHSISRGSRGAGAGLEALCCTRRPRQACLRDACPS
jgi:hypothetical protein